MLLQHQINPSSPDYTDFQFVKYVALNATQYSVFQNTPYAKRDARYVRTHYGYNTSTFRYCSNSLSFTFLKFLLILL